MNNEIFQNNYPSFLNNLFQIIEQNDANSFHNILTKNSLFKNKQILNILFFYCNKDNIFRPVLLSILVKLGLEPNIILENPYKNNNININMNNNDSQTNDYRICKSILMLACENSNYQLVKDLCEINNKTQNPLNVNYFDKNGRNALFYLRGGKDDTKIIKLLVEKGIEVNRKDKDDNTPLHFLILNTMNIQLIYDLIEIGGANFMIKNKEDKNSLFLINEKFIERNHPNNTINNFGDLKPLIKLLKSKLSIKLYPSNKLNENNISELDNNSNLIKLSSLSTTSTNTNTNSNANSNNENSIEDNQNMVTLKNLNNLNIFVKYNPLSLIVDTQFNDNNNISTSKKIDYYTQMNKNKKYLLNLLKNSENHIKENLKNIEEEIKKKKEQVKILQNDLNEKKINLNEINKNNMKKIDILKNDLNNIKNQIKEKKEKL